VEKISHSIFGMNWKCLPGRFGVVALLTVFMLWREEWYPFSHFPMYSAFINQTHYVYVTDSHDRLLPMTSAFGSSSATLKKMLRTKIRRVKIEEGYKKFADIPHSEWEEAAKETLAWLREHHPPRDPRLADEPLRLYLREFSIESGRVASATQLLAEW
jgi:hypothetical protein